MSYSMRWLLTFERCIAEVVISQNSRLGGDIPCCMLHSVERLKQEKYATSKHAERKPSFRTQIRAFADLCEPRSHLIVEQSVSVISCRQVINFSTFYIDTNVPKSRHKYTGLPINHEPIQKLVASQWTFLPSRRQHLELTPTSRREEARISSFTCAK